VTIAGEALSGSWYNVSGRSMWPLAAPLQVALAPLAQASASGRSAGDLAVGDLVVGDIVAFVGTRPGAVFLHRVVTVAGDRIVTRGDTNQQADPPWQRSALVGKVVAVRWRTLAVALPDAGVAALAARAAGRAWSCVAPSLLAAFRRVRARQT
jgi:hypothetical protein